MSEQQVIADKYVVADKLGQGGFGAVYLATQMLVDRKVVIKVMHPELTANEDFVKRFIVEARASSKVVHPNVVTIHDFGYQEGGNAYLVLEYIDGESLKDTLKREGTLDWRRAAHVVRQVAAALAEAHEAEIVHRDIKPENVMLMKKGGDPDFVKVLDFGIAKLREEGGQKLTATGTVMGTPAYMSPEQLEGREVGPASDMFSLGVLLWRALVGKRPFVAPTMSALIVKVLTEAPERPSVLVPDGNLPLAFCDLVMRMLTKDPAERPSSMTDLVKELDGLLGRSGTDVIAARPSTRARPGKRPGWLIPAIAAGVLVVALVVALVVSGGGDAPPPQAPGPTAVAVKADSRKPGPTKPAPPATAPAAPAVLAAPAADATSTPPPSSADAATPLPNDGPALEPGPMQGFRLDGIPVRPRRTP